MDVPQNDGTLEAKGKVEPKDANQKNESGLSTAQKANTLQLPFNVTRGFIQEVLGVSSLFVLYCI